MDRRLFLKGFCAGVAGLGIPSVASPIGSVPLSVTTRNPLWPGFSGRVARSCKIIGIGGAGCNIVSAMYSGADLESADLRPEFICVDLDQQTLAYVAAQEAVAGHLPIKTLLLAPYGAGGWVNGAGALALRKLEVLRTLLAGANRVVLVAGLGGDTGSGVTPIMARLSREAGALTVAAVVTPFEYEGERNRRAGKAIRYLQRETDLVLAFPNEGWAKGYCDDTLMIDVFAGLDCHIAGRIRDLMERAALHRI